jgi:acylphosphatase
MHNRSKQVSITRHLEIHGHVQGVWYRAWAVQAAQETGVSGWVRNRRDGSVEAVVQGAPDDVQRFIERARAGSPASRVDSVSVRDAAPIDADGFAQRPTPR